MFLHLIGKPTPKIEHYFVLITSSHGWRRSKVRRRCKHNELIAWILLDQVDLPCSKLSTTSTYRPLTGSLEFRLTIWPMYYVNAWSYQLFSFSSLTFWLNQFPRLDCIHKQLNMVNLQPSCSSSTVLFRWKLKEIYIWRIYLISFSAKLLHSERTSWVRV